MIAGFRDEHRLLAADPFGSRNETAECAWPHGFWMLHAAIRMNVDPIDRVGNVFGECDVLLDIARGCENDVAKRRSAFDDRVQRTLMFRRDRRVYVGIL